MKWIRPTLALLFAIGMTVGFFMDKISAEAFIGIGSVAITWFFKSRDETKATDITTTISSTN